MMFELGEISGEVYRNGVKGSIDIGDEDDDYIQYMCCDCIQADLNPNYLICGDYSENNKCSFKKDDGSCWKASRED